MKQYVLTAYDHTDAEALQRRMNVRPHHLRRHTDQFAVMPQGSRFSGQRHRFPSW